MGNYALDLNKKDVKEAMKALDLQPEELEFKDLEEFGGPEVSYEKKQLRFEFHRRNLMNNIEQIKTFIKESKPRFNSSINSRDLNFSQINSTERIRVKEESEASIQKIKQKHKDLLVTTINEIETQESQNKAIEERISKRNKAKEKLQQMENVKKKKLKELEDKQKSNLEKLRKDEAAMMRRLQKTSVTPSPQKRFLSNKRHTTKSQEQTPKDRHKEAFNFRAVREQQLEAELQMKLAHIEEKLQKSKQIHENNMQSKKNKASRLQSKANSFFKKEEETPDYERASKIIEKFNKVEKRRNSYLQKQEKEKESLKKKQQERKNLVQQKLREKEDNQKKKAKAIETKIKAIDKVLHLKQENQRKEAELKQEFSKLKDEYVQSAIKKKQNFLVSNNQELQTQQNTRKTSL